jgi:hypothetical protein
VSNALLYLQEIGLATTIAALIKPAIAAGWQGKSLWWDIVQAGYSFVSLIVPGKVWSLDLLQKRFDAAWDAVQAVSEAVDNKTPKA